MTAVDARAPCLIGVAQETLHPGREPAPEPLELWSRVCRAAAADGAASRRGGAVLDAAGSPQGAQLPDGAKVELAPLDNVDLVRS